MYMYKYHSLTKQGLWAVHIVHVFSSNGSGGGWPHIRGSNIAHYKVNGVMKIVWAKTHLKSKPLQIELCDLHLACDEYKPVFPHPQAC